MGSVDKIFLISILVCTSIIIIVGASAVPGNFTKEWSLVDESKIFKYSRDLARGDNGFLYAICSNPKASVQFNCDVYLEKLNKVDNDETNIKICKVNSTLEEEEEKNYVHGVKSIGIVDDNKAILVQSLEPKYNGSSHTRVSIIDMTDCSIKHMDFLNDINFNQTAFQPIVVIFPRSFDVFIVNKKLCGNFEKCRINYDAQGHRIGNPTDFPVNVKEVGVLPISLNSPDKGYFYVFKQKHMNAYRLSYIDPKGVEPVTISLMYNADYILASNSNDSLSICWTSLTKENKIHCIQYDEMGGQRINVSLYLKDTVKPIGMYSLPNDESFWLLTAKCIQKNTAFECSSFNACKIRKGHIETLIRIDNPELTASFYPHEVFFNVSEDQDKLCIYIACVQEALIDGTSTGNKTTLRYIKKCLLHTKNI